MATRSLPSFSGAGVLAALFAACQIAGGMAWVASPGFVPSGYVTFGVICTLCCSVLILSRLTIPNPVRAMLVLGVIAVLLGIAVRSDISGVKSVSNIVAVVTRGGPAGVEMPSDQQAASVRKAVTPALVELRPGEGGDAGWAARLNDAARTGIDSGAPAEIRGSVTLDGGNSAAPRIGWEVTWAGVTLSCGRMSAMGTHPDGLTGQVIGTFKQSITRTAALGRPSCY